MQRGFDSFGSAAPGMALKAMTNTVRIQGLVMAFEDVFLALTVLFLAMACAVPLIRRPRGGGRRRRALSGGATCVRREDCGEYPACQQESLRARAAPPRDRRAGLRWQSAAPIC